MGTFPTASLQTTRDRFRITWLSSVLSTRDRFTVIPSTVYLGVVFAAYDQGLAVACRHPFGPFRLFAFTFALEILQGPLVVRTDIFL